MMAALTSRGRSVGMVLSAALLIALIASASVAHGESQFRWRTKTASLTFYAAGCGKPFVARTRTDLRTSRLKVITPQVGTEVADRNGDVVAKVTSVKEHPVYHGHKEIDWVATPGLSCPRSVPKEPVYPPYPAKPAAPVIETCPATLPTSEFLSCEQRVRMQSEQAWTKFFAEEAALEAAYESEVAALEDRYQEELRAYSKDKADYRKAWGVGGSSVKSEPAAVEYRAFEKLPLPCAGDMRQKCLIRPHQLYTGAHTWIAGIHWKSWTLKGAIGYGRLVERSIYANFTERAKVRLFWPGDCDGGTWFLGATVKSGAGYSKTYLDKSNLTPCV